MGLTLYYFGADEPWTQLEARFLRRRNSYLLRALVAHPDVERVLVVTYCIRPAFFRMIAKRWSEGNDHKRKAVDVYVSATFPELPWLSVLRALNDRLMRLQARWQAGPLDSARAITWCYWPDGFRLADRIGLRGQRVFDADHNILEDPNESAGQPRDVEKCLRECAKKSDLVVAGSRSMLSWFRENGAQRCFFLRNGVDPSRFTMRAARSPASPPRIGYVGSLSLWTDYALLEELARLRPQWKFVVAGGFYRAKSSAELTKLRNVELVGPLKSEEVAAFLNSLDVALGMYKRAPGSDVDSMKLFEYLAAGVPVVTTRFHDFLEVDFEGLLEVVDNALEFAGAIERLLNRDDSAEKKWLLRCKDFVERNTWQVRADEALQLLQTQVVSA